jgi:hypothetical protein
MTIALSVTCCVYLRNPKFKCIALCVVTVAKTFCYKASSFQAFLSSAAALISRCHVLYICHSCAVHSGYDFCADRRLVSVLRSCTDTLSNDLLNFYRQPTLRAPYPTHLILPHLITQIIMVSNTNSEIARSAILPPSAPLPAPLRSQCH